MICAKVKHSQTPDHKLHVPYPTEHKNTYRYTIKSTVYKTVGDSQGIHQLQQNFSCIDNWLKFTNTNLENTILVYHVTCIKSDLS